MRKERSDKGKKKGRYNIKLDRGYRAYINSCNRSGESIDMSLLQFMSLRMQECYICSESADRIDDEQPICTKCLSVKELLGRKWTNHIEKMNNYVQNV